MDVAALLLTGGASRRMGRDKALLAPGGGLPLAVRTAALLNGLGGPALELGPGRSGLPVVPDAVTGAGPLAAVAGGVLALRRDGWAGGALVVATDLPLLGRPLVEWLANHPFQGCVVPTVAGRPQWLCARYDAEALDGAARSATPGGRARELARGRPLHLAPESEWVACGGADSLADADEPADLDRLGLPVAGGQR